jgi:hypothetical protein
VPHRCPNCPGPYNLHEYLMQLQFFETTDYVAFKQWLHTDHSMLETLVKTVYEFIEMLSDKLDT